MKEELFKPFVGRLVRVIIRDGRETVLKKGKLVDVADGFLVLKTLDHTHIIRTDAIVRFQDLKEGGDYE
jgi:RNase P/RNase MRP subunit p29